MSVIIRLQNLPLTASSIDIRTFFRGLSIPDGGVHIVGGAEGDAFIAFSTDEDARQAMQLTGQKLKESTVRLLLSSRNEMFKVIEQARIGVSLGQTPPTHTPSGRSATNSPSSPTTTSAPIPTLPQSNNNAGAFPTSSASGMLGMGLGLGMGGTNPNNFLTQQPPGMNLHQGMTHATPMGFPVNMSVPPPTSNLMNSSGVTSANSNPFGMTTPISGMGMGFPPMIPNSANGLPIHLNPAAMMGNIGLPQAMMNNQQPGSFQGPRGVMNNPNTMNGNSNQNHVPMQMSHGMGMLGNTPRPGGFPSGLSPFVSGEMGNHVRPGGQGLQLNASRAPISMPNANRDRHNVMAGTGASRQGPQLSSGRPEIIRDTRDRRSRSSSKEHRDNSRRRRSRSRDRDRSDRRRRFSKSKSRSRSPKGRASTRRDSRDSRDKEERRRGDSSPEKGRGRRDSDPAPNAYNMTNEEHPAIKLTGIPKDASYREIKDFLRVDVMGGGDGTVRLYDEGIAYVKLEKPSEYPRAYRSNGRKIRNSVVAMEGITIERWVNEYKMNKSRMERDIDRDRERDRVRDRDDRGSEKERPERTHRPSRFNSASQTSFIVIRNLPPTITSRDVSTRLLKDAPMVDMVVSAGPVSNGRHTAMAYVKLDSPQGTQKTIDLIVRSQDGANLVVESCDADDFNQAKSKTAGPVKADPNKPFGDTKSIFDLESGLDDETTSVMIKGAPPNVSDRDVFDFFSDIGLVPMNVKVMYDTHGSCNGQIICEFPDPHKARRATTKDGMLFGRGHVQVELIPSGQRRVVDPSLLSKGPRPALLGLRPVGSTNARFGIPPGPNPFIQALQAANGGPRAAGRGGRLRGPNPSTFNSGRPEFTNSNGVDRDDRLGAGRGRAGPRRVESEAAALPGPQAFGKPGCVLGLENVPYKASMDDILHHLSSILKIDISRERIIRRFDDSEKPTGDARVAFDTPAEAKLAHDRLLGTKMWNRPISYTII